MKTSKSISMEITVWREVEQYGRESGAESMSEAVEQLVLLGLEAWGEQRKRRKGT